MPVAMGGAAQSQSAALPEQVVPPPLDVRKIDAKFNLKRVFKVFMGTRHCLHMCICVSKPFCYFKLVRNVSLRL